MPNFDYQNICTKDTPISERRKKNIGDIWNNSVQCLECNEIIRSVNRHDFVMCGCGNVSVDGGSWYLKRNFKPNGPGYTELSEEFNEVEN